MSHIDCKIGHKIKCIKIVGPTGPTGPTGSFDQCPPIKFIGPTGVTGATGVTGDIVRLIMGPTGSTPAIRKVQRDGEWEFALQAGVTGTNASNDVVTDKNGNIYITGFFTKIITFPGSPSITLTDTGVATVFVAKFDKFGHVIWAINPESENVETNAVGVEITIDRFGDIYIGGRLRAGEIKFDILPPLTNLGPFIAKINQTTNPPTFYWAVDSVVSKGTNDVRGIAVDSTPDIYIIGRFDNPEPFGFPGAGGTIIAPLINGYVAKLNGSSVAGGGQLWIANINVDIDNAVGDSITVDKNNNVYVTGRWTSEVGLFKLTFFNSFPNSGSLTGIFSGNNESMYVARIKSIDGVWLWANTASGKFPGRVTGGRIVADNNQNIYVMGIYEAAVTFRRNPIINGSSIITLIENATLTGKPGLTSIFIAKYNQVGYLLWTNSIENEFEDVRLGNITIDQYNNIYTYTGNVSDQGITYFGSINIPSNSNSTVDVAKLSPGGIWKWVSRLVTHIPLTGGISIDCDTNIVISGRFMTSLTAIRPQPQAPITLNANTTQDLFVAKLSQARFGNALGVLRQSGMVGDFLRVDFFGLSKSFTGLTPGISYYLNQDGVLTEECCHNQEFGDACSSTDMLLTRRVRPNH